MSWRGNLSYWTIRTVHSIDYSLFIVCWKHYRTASLASTVKDHVDEASLTPYTIVHRPVIVSLAASHKVGIEMMPLICIWSSPQAMPYQCANVQTVMPVLILMSLPHRLSHENAFQISWPGQEVRQWAGLWQCSGGNSYYLFLFTLLYSTRPRLAMELSLSCASQNR